MKKTIDFKLSAAISCLMFAGPAPRPSASGQPRTWFRMSADAEKKTAEIMIYDQIGKSFWDDDTVTAKAFDEELKALGDVSEITLRVNSPGGDVFDGVAIYNTLSNHPAKVVARIDGIAASAASLIVMAADEIIMPENAYMLIHEPQTICWGTSEDIMKVAADLESMTATFAATYAKRSGTDATRIEEIMAEDRLMTATEAIELGLADRTAEAVKMVASYSMSLLPESARTQIEASIAATAAAATAAAAQKPAVVPEDKGNVVNLDSVRAQALTEGRAHAKEIADICALAGFPERTGEFIAANTSIDDVRTTLLAAKAVKDDQLQHHRKVAEKMEAGDGKAVWDKAVASLNSRIR